MPHFCLNIPHMLCAYSWTVIRALCALWGVEFCEQHQAKWVRCEGVTTVKTRFAPSYDTVLLGRRKRKFYILLWVMTPCCLGGGCGSFIYCSELWHRVDWEEVAEVSYTALSYDTVLLGRRLRKFHILLWVMTPCCLGGGYEISYSALSCDVVILIGGYGSFILCSELWRRLVW